MRHRTAAPFVDVSRTGLSHFWKCESPCLPVPETVQAFVESWAGKIIAPEFVEMESGKRDRQQLQAALGRCKATGAIFVVVELDRLSRNSVFLLTLRGSEVP